MDALEVWLHGVQVGLLERFPDENYRFSFASGWLDTPDRPVLGQLFEDRRPGNIETSGLLGWFGHLLPQPSGPLFRLLVAEARSRGFVDEDGDATDFMILAMVGADLPGAVELRPGARRWPAPPRPGPRRPRAPSEPEAGGLYLSLAGLQLKLSVNQGEDRSFTVPVSGQGGRWIAKFDRDNLSMPRIEYATTQWARASGIATSDVLLRPVTELRGLPSGFPTSGEVFLSRRFDRAQEGRVHMEDFGQILDRPMPTSFFRGTFEEIALVVSRLQPGDISEVIRRVAFTGLSRELDGHLKNWSITYPDGRNPCLAPAYDLLAGVYGQLSPEHDQMVLPIGGSRRFTDLSADSFRALGALTGTGDAACDLAQRCAREIREAWAQTRDSLPWRPTEIERVEQQLARVPLGR